MSPDSASTGPDLDLAIQWEGCGAAGADQAAASLSAQTLSAGPLTSEEHGSDAWSGHLRRWLAELQGELPQPLRRSAYSIGLLLTDDATIAGLNEQWRHRSGPTDVLAFAAQEEAPPGGPGDAGPEADEPLELGDIVISLETAARQAESAGHGLEQELLFLASHGLLHLLGWDHPDEAALEAMLARQERLLAGS